MTRPGGHTTTGPASAFSAPAWHGSLVRMAQPGRGHNWKDGRARGCLPQEPSSKLLTSSFRTQERPGQREPPATRTKPPAVGRHTQAEACPERAGEFCCVRHTGSVRGVPVGRAMR